MTPNDLRALGLAAWGQEWQAALARALGVNPRTVRYWASGKRPIPGKAAANIRKILGGVNPDWPRDEWIVQREQGKRMYVVHTRRPRFIARIVDTDGAGNPLPTELPADGAGFEAGCVAICEVVWIDPPPKAVNELLALAMETALES